MYSLLKVPAFYASFIRGAVATSLNIKDKSLVVYSNFYSG
jgi:hypothetical protein